MLKASLAIIFLAIILWFTIQCSYYYIFESRTSAKNFDHNFLFEDDTIATRKGYAVPLHYSLLDKNEYLFLYCQSSTNYFSNHLSQLFASHLSTIDICSSSKFSVPQKKIIYLLETNSSVPQFSSLPKELHHIDLLLYAGSNFYTIPQCPPTVSCSKIVLLETLFSQIQSAILSQVIVHSSITSNLYLYDAVTLIRSFSYIIKQRKEKIVYLSNANVEDAREWISKLKYLTNSSSPILETPFVFSPQNVTIVSLNTKELHWRFFFQVISNQLKQFSWTIQQQYKAQCPQQTTYQLNLQSLNKCSVLLLHSFSEKREFSVYNPSSQQFEIYYEFPIQKYEFSLQVTNENTFLWQNQPVQLEWNSFFESFYLKKGNQYVSMDSSGKQWQWKENQKSLFQFHILCCDSFSQKEISIIQKSTPFLFTPHSCQQIETSLHYFTKLVAYFSQTVINQTQQFIHYSSIPFYQWSKQSLPNCYQTCDICFYHPNCNCVPISNQYCDNPLLTDHQSLFTYLGHSILQTEWKELVPPLYVVENELPFYLKPGVFIEECKELILQGHCFSADHVMYEYFKTVQQKSSQQAAIAVIPYYQGCMNHFLLAKRDFVKQVYQYVKENVQFAKQQQHVMWMTLLTHDFGACGVFKTFYWDLLKDGQNYQEEELEQSIIGETNGDFGFACHKPYKDFVIPPRSCHSKQLIQTFSTNIIPWKEKKYLAFYKASAVGTGKLWRYSLQTCKSIFRHQNVSSIALDKEELNYFDRIKFSKFCLLSMGTTGWATRTIDAIYGLCIPVFIQEHITHSPFYDILNYHSFSLQVHPLELHKLEDYLESISETRQLQLFENLKQIRSAFVYDEPIKKEAMHAPFFVLKSLLLKYKTNYEK